MRQSTEAEQVIARSNLFAEQLSQFGPKGSVPPADSPSRIWNRNAKQLSQINSMLEELLLSSPSKPPSTPESSAPQLEQLSECSEILCQLETREGWTSNRLWRQLVTQSLLPLILEPPPSLTLPALHSTSQGEDREASLAMAKFRLRRAWCLSMAAKLIGDEIVDQWLASTTAQDRSPRIAMLESFQLDFNVIAARYWETASRPSEAPTEVYEPHPFVDDSLDRSDWEVVQEQFPDEPPVIPASESPAAHPAPEGYPSDRIAWLQEQLHCLSQLVQVRTSDFERLKSIESQDAPALAELLAHAIRRAQASGGSVSLAVIEIAPSHADERSSRPEDLNVSDAAESMGLEWILARIKKSIALENLECLRIANEQLVLVISDIEKSELTSLVRDSILQAHEISDPEEPTASIEGLIVSGIATVSNPGITFSAHQLIESAWRCLQAATVQGTAGVKSLQVY